MPFTLPLPPGVVHPKILEPSCFSCDTGTMPIQRLNHAVLYVRNLERSVAFYTEALGFRVKNALPGSIGGGGTSYERRHSMNCSSPNSARVCFLSLPCNAP